MTKHQKDATSEVANTKRCNCFFTEREKYPRHNNWMANAVNTENKETTNSGEQKSKTHLKTLRVFYPTKKIRSTPQPGDHGGPNRLKPNNKQMRFGRRRSETQIKGFSKSGEVPSMPQPDGQSRQL
jgi:hypothetical protein